MNPKVRHVGTETNIQAIVSLTNMYQFVAAYLALATKTPIPDKKLKERDSVLIKDHKANVWDPKYTGDYRIMSFPGKAQVEVVDSTGKSKVVHISDINIIPTFIPKLPDYPSFCWQSKVRLDPNLIPNLKSEPTVKVNINFHNQLHLSWIAPFLLLLTELLLW